MGKIHLEKDFIGKKYGDLRILRFDEIINKHRYVTCECECKNITKITLDSILSGHTKTCGCGNFTHGLRHSRIYSIWANMKNRCYNENVPAFKRYGGRGISVCEEWLNFQTFYDWAMLNGYKNNLKIERENNDGNYEPGNCKWATDLEQCHNKGIKSNNKSGTTGVKFDAKYNKWRAYITNNYQHIYLGQFDNKIDAIIARKNAEKQYWNKS